MILRLEMMQHRVYKHIERKRKRERKRERGLPYAEGSEYKGYPTSVGSYPHRNKRTHTSAQLDVLSTPPETDTSPAQRSRAPVFL